MKNQRRNACPARSGQGIFLLACALASALLSSASGGAQEKPPATPTPAQAASAPAEDRNSAAQDAPPAAPIQKRKPGAADPAQRVLRPGDEGAAVFRDDNPGQRERWFYEQRAYPLGYIPFGIRQRAVEARDAMRDRERRLRIGSFAPQWRTAAPEPEVPRTHAIPPNTMAWTHIGPQPVTSSSPTVKQVSGRTSAIAVDPTNPDIVYIGGAQGGVWKTTDGGQNWMPLTDNQPSLAIGAIAIENSMASCGLSGPCRTIYAGTGEQTFSIGSYYGAGILKSNDGGASWQHIPGPFATVASIATGGARISSLAIRPGTGGTTAEILAGVQILFSADSGASSGVYRSVDGGQTWAQVPSASGAVGTDVLFHPTSPNIAYAALGTPFLIGGAVDPQNGVYKSTDGGATWTPINAGLPANRGRIRLAISPSNPNVLFAAVTDVSASSNHLAGVFRSSDAGANWMRVASANPLLGGSTSTVCSSQCWYDLVIRFHPNNEDVAYIGGAAQGGYFLRTMDGGANWAAVSFDVSDRLHVDIHAIAFGISGGTVRMWNGNDGGVWSADVSDPTAAIDWVNHNGPAAGSSTALGTLQYYPGHSIHPSNTDFMIAGTQDNGTHIFNGTLGWFETPVCGDGGFTALDIGVPTTVYAACQRIAINKSINSGAAGSWLGATGAISTSDRSAFIPPLVIDTNPAVTPPFTRRQLYFGTFRVWRGDSDPNSTAAPTWSAISPDLTGGGPTEPNIRAIAISPHDSRIVWAGTSDGRIHRTLDSSQTPASWSNVTGTGMLPNRTVTALAVDPHDPTGNTVYATFSGFTHPPGGDSFGHVFVTTNGGAAWTDISSNLPNTPVNDIVVDPSVPATLFIGTDVGVFFSDDGGVSWMTFQSGFPNVAVLGLKLHRTTRLLRASTHGRGMWDILLTNFNPTFNLASISPSSIAAGSPDTQIVATGAGFAVTSVVQFNATNLVTSFNTMTGNLQATIPAALLAVGQSVAITVFDPTQSPDTTNGLPFTVTNPAPTLTNFSPASIVQGSSSFTLVVNGTGFLGTVGSAPITEVLWNGSVRAANAMLTSPTTISVTIPSTDVATQGTAAVSVRNPGPGGGTSIAQSFNILGPDFSVGVNPAAVTVTRGQVSGAITVTITPLNGLAFSSPVTFSCLGLPSQSTCIFNPTSVTPGANPATATLTITTTAPSMAPPAAPQGMRWSPPPAAVLALLLLALLLVTALFSARAARRAPAWQQASLLLAIVILAGVFVSCGGGGGGGGGGPAPPPPNPGTPTGTFSVTVRGTSGSLQRNAALTLTVQ